MNRSLFQLSVVLVCVLSLPCLQAQEESSLDSDAPSAKKKPLKFQPHLLQTAPPIKAVESQFPKIVKPRRPDATPALVVGLLAQPDEAQRRNPERQVDESRHRIQQLQRDERELNDLRYRVQQLQREERELNEQLEKTDNADRKRGLEESRERLRLESRRVTERIHELERSQHERRKDLSGADRRSREGHEPPQDRPQEAMGRVRALHEAAERVAASGLHDIAGELHRRAEELERQIHREQHEPPAADIAGPLMEQMHQLRGEVRELHEKLDLVLRNLRELEEDLDELEDAHEAKEDSEDDDDRGGQDHDATREARKRNRND